MTPIKVLVLLSGPVAVGKTSVRQALMALHGFDYVRSSVCLKALAAKHNSGDSRTILQDLGDELDRRTDFRWILDDVALPGFAAALSQQRWLIDAVRKKRQVEHFRDAFGPAVLHVHLTASEDVLRQRYMARLTTAGDATPYETAIQHENELASRGLIEVADLVFDTELLPPEEVAEQIRAAAA